MKKNQTNRLSKQHKKSKGPKGIFGDENARSSEYDKNKFAYGIWDHVGKRPKQAFFEVYKYYTAK